MVINDIKRIQRPIVASINRAEKIKSKRRSFLKYLLFGSGSFLAGKIFGPSIDLFSSSRGVSNVADFKSFRVVETDKDLSFFDKMGNEILVIDKEL